MKELSIEEKAKRYDEVIETFDVILNLNTVKESGTIFADDVRKILPELKESEDEKVRKELYDFCIKCGRGETIVNQREEFQRWADWLEKQGEKSVDKLKVSDELYEHIRNTCACIDDALSSETLGDINDYLSMAEHSAQSAFDMIEKQGDQNPAWSEEDEKEFNVMKSELEKYIMLKQYGTPLSVHDIEWFKSIKDRVQPQNTWKPSEEQMDALYTYIYNPQYFNSPDTRMELVESVYKDLKKLREE